MKNLFNINAQNAVKNLFNINAQNEVKNLFNNYMQSATSNHSDPSLTLRMTRWKIMCYNIVGDGFLTYLAAFRG